MPASESDGADRGRVDKEQSQTTIKRLDRFAAATDPAPGSPLKSRAAGQVKGVLTARYRSRVRNCLNDYHQAREFAASAAESVRREVSYRSPAETGQRDYQARIPSTRSLIFFLNSLADIVAEQGQVGNSFRPTERDCP